jgi:putative transposase
MIIRNHSLPLVKQCQTLNIARSGLYYHPESGSDMDLALMRLIDEIHLNRPFLGSRRITDALHDAGHNINHKRV